MRTSLLYTKTILSGNRYLLISVPLLAIIGFFALFLLTWNHSFDLMEATISDAGIVDYNAAMQLAGYSYFEPSIVLVFVLPLAHLLLLQKLYYRLYELTLPVSPAQRFLSYLFTAAIIYIANLLIIMLLNYLTQVYFQSRYLEVCTEAFDKLGYLYEGIRENSILNNANVNYPLMKIGLFFFVLLPLHLYALLYFRKYSLLKFIGIITVLMTIGIYFLNKVWSGHPYYINNESYVELFPIILYLLASIACYVGFYFLLKEKEV